MRTAISAETINGICVCNESEIDQPLPFIEFYQSLPDLPDGKVIFCRVTDWQLAQLKDEYGVTE